MVDEFLNPKVEPSEQKMPAPGQPNPPGYVDDGKGGAYYDPTQDPTLHKSP